MSIHRVFRPAAGRASAARRSASLRSPLLLLSLAVAVALVPTAARAQPACDATTLDAYLAPDFACRIDHWVFEEFDHFTFTSASPGVSAHVGNASVLDVIPFRRVDARGRVSVGFDFLGFLGASVTTTGSQRGDERGTAVSQIQFYGRALTPAAALIGARAELSAGTDGTEPALSFITSQSFSLVDDVFSSVRCLDATTLSPPGGGFVFDEHAGLCADAPAREVFALTGNITVLDRDDDSRPVPLFGFATGSVQSVTFVTAQVVPEPSTIVLSASGLLGLALMAARRRALARRARLAGRTTG